MILKGHCGHHKVETAVSSLKICYEAIEAILVSSE